MFDPEFLRTGAKASGAVLQLSITVSLSAWLGKTLDSRYGTEPWLTLLLTVFGFAISLLAIARIFSTDDPPESP